MSLDYVSFVCLCLLINKSFTSDPFRLGCFLFLFRCTDHETCLEGLSRGLHLARRSNCKTGKTYIFDLLHRLEVLKCDCDSCIEFDCVLK